ncbi:MAG: DUF222 domain-containing protein [Acidimicrobiia bacterium]
MSTRVRQAIELLLAELADVDPSCVDGSRARELMEDFAEVQHLGGAGVTIMARRVEAAGAFDLAKHRSAAHYLAKVTGTTVFAAEQQIRTARQLEDLPATHAALRAGRLSGVQVKEVAAAAAADPSAEPMMLRCAQIDGIKGLKAEGARVIAAAARDADKQYERIHRERTFRHWSDYHGSGRIDVRGPLDLTTRVALALVPYEHELFEAARKNDERERADALMFDALVAMADASTGEMPKGTGPMPTIAVRIDHRAFVTGDTLPGEVCEIAGVGPIPVSVAQRLAEDAFLKALVTNGVDVLAVSHLGRTIPAHLRTALEELYPECAIAGCNASYGLEIDHNQPVEVGGLTERRNLNKLCRYHHTYKHRHKLRLVGEGTNKRFLSAAEWLPPDRPPDCPGGRQPQGQPPRAPGSRGRMMLINANVDAWVMPPVGCHGRPPRGAMVKQQRATEADAPVAADSPATCATNGAITSRRLSPDGFSIWLYVSELEPGASLEWGREHGDEAVYVISGALGVDAGKIDSAGAQDGKPENDVERDASCPAGGALIVESGVAGRVVASGFTKVAHFGSANPSAALRGATVHVIGPRGRYESPPDKPFFRFFADSTCETCDAFLLFSQRDDGWSVTPHSHSADELIYVLSGGVRTGNQVNSTGTCLAFPANVKYALAAEPSGFETINFRARRSELKFVDADGTIEETAANVGGVEVQQ